MKKSEREYLKRRKLLLSFGKLKTLKDMIERVSYVYDNQTAIVDKVNKQVTEHTVKELCSDIYSIGTALISMGLKNKNIAVLSEGSYRWIVSFLGVCSGTGTVVPLDKDLSDEALVKLISKSDCEAVFCSKSYIRTLKAALAENDKIKHVILLSGKCEDEKFCSFEKLTKKGNELLRSGNREFLDADVQPKDIAAIIFTSGTTGSNKGVMLSHKNLCSNIDGLEKYIKNERTVFSILPMNHAFELACSVLPSIYLNITLYINDSLRNILTNIHVFRPDAFFAVPLILETMYKSIWDEAEKNGKDEQLRKGIKLSNRLMKMGIDARSSIFSEIREKFGGRFQTIICGGAPSKPEYIKGLYELGFNIYEGYGLTECSPVVALNTDAGNNPFDEGLPYGDAIFEIRDIDSDGVGEIWISGDNVACEYYKDPAATQESFINGWFRSGDYGVVTDKGHLKIVGRKKNIIVLDNGKNVFPEDIELFVEERLKFISESVVFEATKENNGKEQKIIAACFYIDRNSFPGISDEEIKNIAKKELTVVNRRMSIYKRINDYEIFFEPFPKTATKKIIRDDVKNMYKEKKNCQGE